MIRGDEAGAYKNIVNVRRRSQSGRNHQRRLRDREMKRRPGIAALIVAAAVLLLSHKASCVQAPIPVRRALPVQEPPVARALPVETPPPAAGAHHDVGHYLADVTDAIQRPLRLHRPPAATSRKRRFAEQNQSATPTVFSAGNSMIWRCRNTKNFSDFIQLRPLAPPRYFYMGQAYRALNRTAAARTSFQTILRDFPDGELAGPASYGLAEISFNEKDYAWPSRFFIAPPRK